MTDAKINYKYLDVARGLALLLVITSHAHGLNRFLIYYYIQIFFIISGYTYRQGCYQYREIIKKKARRLLIPYFGYSAMLWCFYMVIRKDGEMMKKSLFGILYSRFCLYKTTNEDNVYLLDIANGAMWYLTAFFMTSLLFYLIVDKCLADKKKCILIIVILLVITGGFNELPILLPWSIDIVAIATVLMLCGAILRKRNFFEQSIPIWMIVVTVVVYMCTVEVNGRLNMSIREYGRFEMFSIPFFLIISVTGSILCIWMSKWVQNTFIGTFLSYLGTHTIELLCLHMVVLEIFQVITEKFIDVNDFSGVAECLYVLVRVTVAVSVSLIAGRMISWVTGRIKLKKWKEKKEIRA